MTTPKRLFKSSIMLAILWYANAGDQKCQDLVDDSKQPCIVIQNWSNFVNAFKINTGTLSFCPFDIQKPPSIAPLLVTGSVIAMCRSEGGCIINSLSAEANGVLNLSGNAEVTMHGFVFQAEGSPFDSFSAIHIKFATPLLQTFCSCNFRGFRGQMRGVAIRSEPRTRVSLMKCIFEDNSSNDVGTIFNRGVMDVDNCSFKNNGGKGGAIGSSLGSSITIQNSVFNENTLNVPIFFHGGDDYIDGGGNSASNNAKCNGIYVDASKKCITFETSNKAIGVVPTSETDTNTIKAFDVPLCQKIGVETRPCISIGSFAEFKGKVEKASGVIVFCSFIVNKSDNDVAYITSALQIICVEPKKCIINGSKSQINIVGNSAQVFFQGFVFQGSTGSAIQISSSAMKKQHFCNCSFLKNQGQSRGVGLLAERNTNVEVTNCYFEDNRSTDIGGSIFSRGSLKVIYSSFTQNSGPGGAIGNAPRASLSLLHNTFTRNNGVPIFLHDQSYTDLGQNIAIGNSACNGLWIHGLRKCIIFERSSNDTLPVETDASNPVPPKTPATNTAQRGGIGYFNYNINDNNFGPNTGWGKVKENPEHLRYQELSSTLKRSLVNKCDWRNINQSPIDLCENKINNDCDEYHQTRTHSGNIQLTDQQVTAQILPSKLRLKYYSDRPPIDGPYPPEADFANNWNGFAEVNHIDIKIPSEHTICGKRFPAEYSIYMTHPLRRQTIVMSILLSIHEDDKRNEHLQEAIDEWQKLYDTNDDKCNNKSRTLYSTNNDVGESDARKIVNGTKRELRDETPFGRGGWDPFHQSLERTIYFWGYWGSLTEPPCSTFVAWRVLTEPAFISTAQLEQMQRILFTYRNENCQYKSVNFQQSVARPTQANRGRLLHKCSVTDYVSDIEKDVMRKKTGNPDWCC